MQHPLKIQSLSFSYDAREDRLLLIVADAAGTSGALMLTRRITGLLVNGLAELLKRSSQQVKLAPEDIQDDLIQLEHSQALSHTPTAQEPAGEARKPEPQAGQQVKSVLISDIRITVNPKNFTLGFLSGETDVAVAELTRLHVHRVVEVIARKARDSGWALDLSEGWLGAPLSGTSVN